MAMFVAASLVAVMIFVAASVPLLRQIGRDKAIRDARGVARLAAEGVVEPNLGDGLLDGKAGALTLMDRVVQERVLSESIVRVKIWSADGRILYSDEPRLIGTRYPLGEDELAALELGDVDAELSDLSRPENRFERDEGELLEVYTRIRTPNGTPVLFELYERFDSVLASGRRIWLAFLPALLAALILLWLVHLPLAYRLARRVRSGHEERELLLRRTLDASNDERRRIAGELHDGVVQDLAGTSYALAAATGSNAARHDPALLATLQEGAAVTRASVQRLRELLVAIHPANLRTTGLEAALADVVAPLERRGIDVEVELEQLPALDREAEELMFRAAREAVRNVLDHADATHVTVRVEQLDGKARLTVADDGSGFSAEQRERRLAEGHVGLSLLEELAAHAGATLEVRSAPGRGTVLVLEAKT
jgi:signal transduction histidine kinase